MLLAKTMVSSHCQLLCQCCFADFTDVTLASDSPASTASPFSPDSPDDSVLAIKVPVIKVTLVITS